DFYDAFNIQALSAILFIYLATVTNAITFGGLLGDATENMQVSHGFEEANRNRMELAMHLGLKPHPTPHGAAVTHMVRKLS
ncbi:hypothetical protein L345_18211, partial [Ophiophagus hannah]